MFSSGNEIVTLALGHYSAHVAAHFYNIQEASFSYNPNFKTGINHDALFRENVTSTGETYTPRLIIADDSDALGFLSRDGNYKENDIPTDQENTGAAVIIKENLWERNEFIYDYIKEKKRLKTGGSLTAEYLLKNSYNLDDSVVSWSDYLTTELCDKTIITLPKTTDYYENYDGFSNFHSGSSLWNKTVLNDVVEENIRFFMEETDNLQGFQILFDGDNGYAGISAGCLELLRDEYNKKAILTIPTLFSSLANPEDIQILYKKRCEKAYSLASGLSSVSQHSDIVAPMSHLFNPWGKTPIFRIFKNVNYKYNLMYHSSAILAAALDLLTLPYRLQTSPVNLNNISSTINIYGRNVAAVGFNLPVPINRNDTLYAIQNIKGKVFESLSPLLEVSPEVVDTQWIGTKGLGKNDMNINPELVDEFLKQFLHRTFPRVLSCFGNCRYTFRVPRTFPKIMEEQFNFAFVDNCYGPLSEFIGMGGLHNSREMGKVINDLLDEVKSIKGKRIPSLGSRDTEVEYEDLFENLRNVGYKYSDYCFV